VVGVLRTGRRIVGGLAHAQGCAAIGPEILILSTRAIEAVAVEHTAKVIISRHNGATAGAVALGTYAAGLADVRKHALTRVAGGIAGRMAPLDYRAGASRVLTVRNRCADTFVARHCAGNAFTPARRIAADSVPALAARAVSWELARFDFDFHRLLPGLRRPVDFGRLVRQAFRPNNGWCYRIFQDDRAVVPCGRGCDPDRYDQCDTGIAHTYKLEHLNPRE